MNELRLHFATEYRKEGGIKLESWKNLMVNPHGKIS